MQKNPHPSAVDGEFNEAPPPSPPTALPPQLLNTWIRELCNFVKASGQQLDPQDFEQMIKAVPILAQAGAIEVRRNLLINGAMDINQSGFGVLVGTQQVGDPPLFGYGLDRYRVERTSTSGTVRVTQRAHDLSAAPNGFSSASLRRWLCYRSTVPGIVEQRAENPEVLAGKTCTWHFVHRLAPGTPAGGYELPLRVRLNYGVGGSDTETLFEQTVTVTADPEMVRHFQVTFQVPSFLGKVLGADAYLSVGFHDLQIPGMVSDGNLLHDPFHGLQTSLWQLEVSPSATAFEATHPASELWLASRYFQKSTPSPVPASTTPGNWMSLFGVPTTAGGKEGALYVRKDGTNNEIHLGLQFRSPMRATPEMRFFGVAGTPSVVVNPPLQDVIGISKRGVVAIETIDVVADGAPLWIHWDARAEL